MADLAKSSEDLMRRSWFAEPDARAHGIDMIYRKNVRRQAQVDDNGN
jgi:hypothetical protein